MAPITVTPRADPPENEGALGVALDMPLEERSYPVWEAVPLGVRATYNSVRALFLGIQAAVRGQMPFQVTGPIGIYQTTVEIAQTGIERLLEFTAFLSLNLFLVNLLPLPALDGGRLIFVLLEWLRGGKRVPPEKEGVVHAIGMVLLIALMVVVTFADYLRYFG
jgi:regulator of sigma E protease